MKLGIEIFTALKSLSDDDLKTLATACFDERRHRRNRRCAAAYYEKNREKMMAYGREYYQKTRKLKKTP